MPYEAREAHGFTRKANTGSRSRQWAAVYESSRRRGDDEGTAITKAQGVVKKNWKKTNPARRKPSDRRPEHMKVAATSPYKVLEAPSIGGSSKVLSSARRPSQKVVKAPKVKTGPQSLMAPKAAMPAHAPTPTKPIKTAALTGVSFGKEASETVKDMAAALVDPENPPGRIGKWKRMLQRLGLGTTEKVAIKMTASSRIKGLRAKKTVPTVKATDVEDVGKRMTSEARRMSLEAGKGPVVSKKKLMKKHTRRGGRLDAVRESVEAGRTFTSPGQDQPGVRTVQFKDKPSGAKSSPVAKKAKRKPAGKK